MTRGSAIVRPARADDIPELARVHHESSEAAYSGVAPFDPDGLPRREARWREVFATADVPPWVAEVNGAIVGVLEFGPAEREPGSGEIHVLYVHPDWWGTGVGQELIEHAEEQLSTGYSEALLTVLADNPRARRFYERNGWRLDGLEVEPHFGGHPTEVARYRKRLQRPET